MINWNSLTITSALASIIGIGLNAYQPIASQSFVEKLFPASELVLMTGFMIGANIFGLVGNIMTSIPCNNNL